MTNTGAKSNVCYLVLISKWRQISAGMAAISMRGMGQENFAIWGDHHSSEICERRNASQVTQRDPKGWYVQERHSFVEVFKVQLQIDIQVVKRRQVVDGLIGWREMLPSELDNPRMGLCWNR